MKEETPTNKICESCGAEFSCGAFLGKCWCFDVALSAETLAKLQKEFKSCLCAECLANHVTEVGSSARETGDSIKPRA